MPELIDQVKNLCLRLEIVVDQLRDDNRKPMAATVEEAIEVLKKVEPKEENK